MPGLRLETSDPAHPSLRRRGFLGLGAGAVATAVGAGRLVVPEHARAAELDALDESPFTLGVASGDPAPDSVVLWTRLAPEPLVPGGGMSPAPVEVTWEVARDEQFRTGRRSGRAVAAVANAHSVHVEVPGLRPHTWYWYRFTAGGVRSRTGRTRTLPAPGARVDRLRFAVASCQSWAGGAYPAYRDMAEHDLDLVLHLGDYIYETAGGSLEEFRRLHGQYKTSAQLRDAHAAFPFVTTWDDHEVQNNYADDVPGAAGDGRPFLERRANAYQAYFEHLPLRQSSRPVGPDMLLHRRLDVGRLARVSVLDTRQYRSDQACGDGRRVPCAEVSDPARTMTGPEQERWLLEGLDSSPARWNVIAQQTIMAQFDYDLGPDLVVNLDQWDGYPAARSRILGHLATRGTANPVVLSGDWHTAWVNDLTLDFDDPASPVVASEFVGTSISSGAGWDADVRAGLAANPHVKYYNGSYRGWTLCDVTPERWETTLRVVLSPSDAASAAYTTGVFAVASGRPGAVRVGDGDGLVGRATGPTGEPLPAVEVSVTQGTTELLAVTTGPDGAWQVFVPPGTYAVTANAVGYEPVSTQVTVTEGTATRADTALAPVTVARAGTGRLVPGPRAEGRAGDVVLENAAVALCVSAGTQDPQLSPTTLGKVLDLAGVGHVDQLDWVNLPYASTSRPTGPSAWQQRTVLSSAVEVLASPAGTGRVRATGTSTQVPTVAVVTDYEVVGETPWVTATSVLTNTGGDAVTLFVGDALDHDGTGQRSGVPGTGTVDTASADVRSYTPTAPWIGATGSDRQTYALVYDDTDFTAYGCGIWIMSIREVTLAAGQSFSLRRRLVAVDSGPGDPWAPLAAI